MTPAEKQGLNDIITALETVQRSAPTKTTYTMGRADHSISHQLTDIIRKAKALINDAEKADAPTEPITIEPEPAKGGAGKAGK